MPDPTVVICIDGLDPEYLDACESPAIDHLAAHGFLKVGRSMMPSVTNVNNVSLLTASYPQVHGICSNYVLFRDTGEEAYTESSEYILAETLFQRGHKQGKTTVLVTAKDKLRSLLGEGATVAVSSERPPEWVVEGVGPPPEIYSLEVNGWVIKAATFIMSRHPTDFVYVTTTDYAMHTHAPGEPESARHMSILDDAIGELVEAHPRATVLLTADHGMAAKTRMVDLQDVLRSRGIGSVNPVPIIKDRYVAHHSNLGGCMFLYIGAEDVREALKVLRDTPGVEEAFSREVAVDELRLHSDRIGDVVVTGEKDVVFGDPSEVSMPPRLRTHGSLHETRVPILGYNGAFDGFGFEENRDVGRFVLERLLT